ncbi:hypothetical protein J6590_103472, partial [Homalodisca vitripennis]
DAARGVATIIHFFWILASDTEGGSDAARGVATIIHFFWILASDTEGGSDAVRGVATTAGSEAMRCGARNTVSRGQSGNRLWATIDNGTGHLNRACGSGLRGDANRPAGGRRRNFKTMRKDDASAEGLWRGEENGRGVCPGVLGRVLSSAGRSSFNGLIEKSNLGVETPYSLRLTQVPTCVQL